MGILKDMIDSGDFATNRFRLFPSFHSFLEFGNKVDIGGDLPDIWRKNARKNIRLFKNHANCKGIADLPDFKDRAVIVVGASPVLKKQVRHLKDANDRFVIVAVNSSAGFLVDHGIVPHYVAFIDGRKGPWSLDLGDVERDVTAIFSPFAEHETIKAWQGPIVVLPLQAGDKEIDGEIVETWGGPAVSGGNAFNTVTAALAQNTRSRVFLFVGNELSFKGRKYYADGECAGDGDPYFRTKDIHGRMVRIHTPLYTYKIWLENFMAISYPEFVWINCSGGILGVDVDGKLLPYVYQVPLDEGIALAKGAFHFDTLPWEERTRLTYETLYRSHGYYPLNSKSTWGMILQKLPPFVKGLDVGCGTGAGLRMALSAGCDVYGTDIVVPEAWGTFEVADRCRQAPAHRLPFEDDEFDLVVCSEVLEHIPEEGVALSLQEMCRVGSDKFFFTIALMPDSQYHHRGVNLHTTLRPKEWWLERLQEAGYQTVIEALSENDASLIVYAVKDMVPYNDGKPLFREDENAQG